MAELGCRLTTIVVLTLAGATSLEGQVGLSSGVAQVSLVVRAAPRVSLPAISRTRETARTGGITAAEVSVRFSANGPYRLVVRSTESRPGTRLWVRGVDGAFQEVGPGSVVTVARGAGSTAELDRRLIYRIETADGDSRPELPVRYEIVMDPTI